jgi:ribosomal protein S6--L-glutamate ligase
MDFKRKVVALEGRLRRCRNVVTIGVRPNFCDYGPEEREMIRTAETVYYPTVFYADLFNAAGKNTFPSYHTYKCVQDKIKQTALFELLGIPHPCTRVFYGNRQKAKIGDFFQFPFIAKIPRGSARGKGVYLIRDSGDLDAYCGRTTVAYIQEYLPIDRDMRVVVIGRRIAHAYWRITPEGEFRSNVSVGGRVSLDPVPEEALQLALQTARSCGWNDVGIDICRRNGSFCVLEANMKYGLEGFRKAGIDYVHLLETMIEQHEI